MLECATSPEQKIDETQRVPAHKILYSVNGLSSKAIRQNQTVSVSATLDRAVATARKNRWFSPENIRFRLPANSRDRDNLRSIEE